MSTAYISPGVYTEENDLSQYVSDLSATIVAMVGTSTKGPSNSPVLITSAKAYVDIFGQPNPSHYLGYAALAYLKQGNKLYVNRITPSDAKKARLTLPLPKTYEAYNGDWELTAFTNTTATLKLTNPASAVGAPENQFVTMTAATTGADLPGFNFQDNTGVDSIVDLLGSDLSSFVAQQTAGFGTVDKYVKGRKFKISTGAGHGSDVVIKNLVAGGDVNSLSVTVDSTTFNTFNTPVTSTPTGALVSVATTLPGSLAVLAVVGSTSTGGQVRLIFDETGYTTAGNKDTLVSTLNAGAAGAMAALETLVSVVGTNVLIEIPLYATGAGQAAKNAALVAAILSAIISAFRGALVLGTNMALIAAIAKATSTAGIIGLGTFVTLTGVSAGIKSAEVQSDGVTIKLSAIVTGLLGYFDTVAATPVLTPLPINISGTFSLDLYRPTWVTSLAGTAHVPTLLKFSSVGEGDFSNLSITVELKADNLTVSKEQKYIVAIYKRLTSDTISATSVSQADFSISERYEGTPETIQSNINANSKLVALKLDYSSEDTVDMETGAIATTGTVPDNIVVSFALVENSVDSGVVSGTITTISGASFVPTYQAFLTGGSTGSPITSSDIIGSIPNKTGIYAFYDPEQYDINLAVAPGWSADPAVSKALIGLCDPAGGGRGDCMAILDTPFGLTVDSLIKYKKNVLNINSNYAAIYYPWVKVLDTVNQKQIFIPPSGMVVGQYAYNDKVGDVFTAPAGINRGNLTDVLSTERILNQGDRDMLALAQVNPIHFEAGYGIYIRGQMTTQVATTALDRVNVRRLFLNLRKVIATASKKYEFEPGDAITALRLKQLAESVLEDRLRKGAIRSFKVDVGPNINTALSLDNNELRMAIEVVPTKTAEKIIEVFNILGQGQGLSVG